MVEFPRREHQPGGGVHRRLESFQLVLWNAGEGGVPKVQTSQDERRYQGLDDGSGKRPANRSQLTQYGAARGDCLRDLRPHGNVRIDIDTEVADNGGWQFGNVFLRRHISEVTERRVHASRKKTFLQLSSEQSA